MSDLLLKIPNVYEPKKKNRFLIRFPSDLGVQEWYVESAKRPSIQTNSVEIPFLNTSTWVAGSYKWQEMQVTFRDPIGPSATQALMEWIRLCDESVTGRQGYAVSYKRDIELEMLDPTGVVVEKWILVGCWLTTYDGGDLAYNDDGLATVSATLRPDYCINAY